MSELAELLAPTTSMVGAGLERVGWAEDEIEAAQRRHPAAADRLFHAFALLAPTEDRMVASERVYRAHARELLERVAAGADTRPGTDIELVLLCARVSLVTPLNRYAFTLYMRVFARALPELAVLSAEEASAYERVAGSGADSLEEESRRRLARSWRKLGAGDPCRGVHHGEPHPSCSVLLGRTD